MSRYTWITIAASAIGIGVPVWYLIPGGAAALLVMAWIGLPFFALAITGWLFRHNSRMSMRVAALTTVELLLALVSWTLAAEDEKGINLVLTGFALPFAQLAIWGVARSSFADSTQTVAEGVPTQSVGTRKEP